MTEEKYKRLIIGLTLATAVVIGLWLRWDNLEYAEFGHDQALSLSNAREMLATGHIPLNRGQGSIVGPAHGPMEVYLLAIPAALSPDPRVATAFVGLLQMVAVVGSYFFASRYFGRSVGLFASILFAVNPWAVEHSRKVWTPDTMPLFTLLLFAAVFFAIVERHRQAIIGAFVSFAVLFLTHLSAVVLAPVLGLLCLLFWHRLGLKPLVAAAVICTLVAAPYLLSLHQAASTDHAKSASSTVGDARTMDLQSLSLAVSMASASGYPALLGNGFRNPVELPDMSVPNSISTLLLLFGLVVAAFRAMSWVALSRSKTDGGDKYLILLLWFAIPVLVTSRYPASLQPYYLVVLFPVQWLLIGIALGRVVSWLSKLTGRVGINSALAPGLAMGLIVLLLSVSQVAYARAYLFNVIQSGTTGAYRTPLRYSEQAIGTLRSLRQELDSPLIYTYSYSLVFADSGDLRNLVCLV